MSNAFQASTNLTNGITFTNLSSPIGLIDFRDDSASNFPLRFYRVLAQSGP